MNELLSHLIESLREELKHYGEMLALLDHQQNLVMERQANDLFQSVSSVNAQAGTIAAARREREQRQRSVAQNLNLSESVSFAELIPKLPADYRPLVQALVQENNELLVRVQQRARQNHLLLSRVVDLMQKFINTISPTPVPTTYDAVGHVHGTGIPQHSLYEAVG